MLICDQGVVLRVNIMTKIAIALIGLAACSASTEGNIKAGQLGDTSHPAQRGSPVEAVRTACNDVTSKASPSAIKRQPYLQQVTTESALVGWVTTEPGSAHVTLSDPAGTVLASTPGIVEQYSMRTAAENQMWSKLGGLSAASIYCYEVGNESELTTRTGFKTAPAPDDPAPVRFLAFGDSGGGGADQYALLEQMYSVPYDLMIHTGDLAYDTGTIAQFEDNVFGVYADLFRNIPFFPAAGNHDYDTLRGAPFRGVFNLPGDSGEKWYSYDWGRVHFAALDTEADYATQAKWLDDDLAATNLPWKIVYLHKPLYSSGTHGSDLALRSLLEPVLQKHNVQLVLAGHDHNYERMKPQHGITHVVTGGGGVGTRPVGVSGFTEFSHDVIHFVYVEVGVDELVLHAIDGMGTEFDSVVVPRD